MPLGSPHPGMVGMVGWACMCLLCAVRGTLLEACGVCRWWVVLVESGPDLSMAGRMRRWWVVLIETGPDLSMSGRMCRCGPHIVDGRSLAVVVLFFTQALGNRVVCEME
jgi:hypothetical protein